jgi:hypothetical protein
MTAERDFIRKHPDTSPKAMIALASHAGLTITSRLIGKVRYYDRKKLRERIAEVPERIVAARKTSKPWAPAPSKVVGPLGAVLDAAKRMSTSKTKRKEPPVVKLVRSLQQDEQDFLLLAYEIGHERSCELLDLWRESVRRVVASL